MKISILSIAFFLVFTIANAQQTLNRSLIHDNVVRDYIVYVPEIYDENTPTPLMFNFHGWTMQASAQMNSCDMRYVADTADFILVYPQGVVYQGFTHWNVGSWTAGSTADDVGFTSAMIDQLAEKYNIDLNRVYACGWSNGAYFSYELACQLSDRIAAIGSVSGVMSDKIYNACNPTHSTPVITIHGTADNSISYNGTFPINSLSVFQTINYWLGINQLDSNPVIVDLEDKDPNDGSLVELRSYESSNGCASVVHYRINGGGHTWPGSWGNKDIDASEVIWNFVSKYDLNGLVECDLVVSTETINDSDNLRIYPNPARNSILVNTVSGKFSNYSIYSIAGKLVQTGELNTFRQEIDVSGLKPNMYLFKVGSKTFKFIKVE
ncbi:MAG: T9SS type A sorting domain-containing protein [Bacteroidota bacterium]